MDMPQSGGSWTRDPKTGALRRTGEAAAETPADVVATDAAPPVDVALPADAADEPATDPDGAAAPKTSTPKGRGK